MSIKKSDYFGKFLDTLPDPNAPAESAEAVPFQNAQIRGSREGAPIAQSRKPSLIEAILLALKGGAKSLGDLISLTKSIGSLTDILDATKELGSFGYVERLEPDIFRLTERGLDALNRMADSPPS